MRSLILNKWRRSVRTRGSLQTPRRFQRSLKQFSQIIWFNPAYLLLLGPVFIVLLCVDGSGCIYSNITYGRGKFSQRYTSNFMVTLAFGIGMRGAFLSSHSHTWSIRYRFRQQNLGWIPKNVHRLGAHLFIKNAFSITIHTHSCGFKWNSDAKTDVGVYKS